MGTKLQPDELWNEIAASEENRPMQIWVDADACPVEIKELLYRTAERLKIKLTLVANQSVRVRKVQSAGRNQAVIIHTATGRHLEELQAKFADVGFSSTESELLEPIENLRNLGPTSAAWLREAGITTISELSRLGPVLVYRLVKEKQPRASLSLLWGLAAGLLDVDWRELNDEETEKLRKEAERE